MTLLKINVPTYKKNVRPFQINDPPCQINVPYCQINVPLSNKLPKFWRQNHDPRDIYLQEGHIFVSLFDHVYGPLSKEFKEAIQIQSFHHKKRLRVLCRRILTNISVRKNCKAGSFNSSPNKKRKWSPPAVSNNTCQQTPDTRSISCSITDSKYVDVACALARCRKKDFAKII